MADPKKGTGKKPKGSGRRLYTDENPKDTVSIIILFLLNVGKDMKEFLVQKRVLRVVVVNLHLLK